MSFISEVREHPLALTAMLDHCNQPAEKKKLAEFLAGVKPGRVIFSGMGSSFFSSQAAALYLRRSGYDAVAVESGELSRAEFRMMDNADLLVAVSQTGNSKELVELCGKVNGRIPVLSVTNRPESPVGKFGDFVFELCAGQELFTSSKTYTNTLAALLVLCDALLVAAGSTGQGFAQQLYLCAGHMQALLDAAADYKVLAKELASITNYTMIGSGFSRISATHSELVAAEVAKIFGSRFTLGQYIHGPVEMISRSYAYFIFDSDPNFDQASDHVIDTILRLGGIVFRIGNRSKERSHSNYRQIILPHCPLEWLPMLEVIVMELLFNEVGLAKGLEPGALTIVQK